MRVRITTYSVLLLLLALNGVARAAVRVEADEVIFSVRAPETSEVYLVGDFNRWNPTVEPMAREGDEFVVRLFLVAGTYRYKFVVDGKPIDDPDNPPSSPGEGSPIVLVERSGGLILSTEIPEEAAAKRTASYGARYIGILRLDDGESDGEQRVDLGVRANLDRLRARAIVASADSSWHASPLAVDAIFDRGYVDVEVGKLAVRGFENDSTWASSDPLQLIGNAGVYDYDAGFRYHGATAVAAGKHAALRARWADETQRGGVARASASLGSFAAGTSADTTAYAYSPTFNGSDMLAVEATANSGGLSGGYVFRNDTGVNPGLWVDVSRRPTDFATQTYATREERQVSHGWLSWNGLWSATVTGGYGWGEAEARAFATASDVSDLSVPLDASAATTAFDAARGILDSDRFVAEVSTRDRVAVSARWDYTRFEFDGVQGDADADVHRARLDATTTLGHWRIGAGAVYTDQQYRDTPDALYVDWPERNLWLSRWDEMDIPSMVAIDLPQHTVWSVDATYDGARVDAGADALLQTLDVVDSPLHGSARAYADVGVYRSFYVYGDARLSWYDRNAWGVNDTFLDLYVEGGYRGEYITLSAGFGLDPWVFDPVIGEFADIGRSEFLRQAIAGGVRRSDATEIGAALIELERALEDVNLFKLECIIELR